MGITTTVKDKVGARVQNAIAPAVMKLPSKVLRKMAGDPLVVDGRTLDVRLQLAAAASAKGPAMSQLDPESAREAAAAAFAQTNGKRAAGVSTQDRSIGTHGLGIRIYRPANTDDLRPGVLFMHQGGFVLGDLDTCDEFCSRLAAQLSAVVVSLDYRLAPEHPFPAQSDDADEAWAWMNEHAEGLGITARDSSCAATLQEDR